VQASYLTKHYINAHPVEDATASYGRSIDAQVELFLFGGAANSTKYRPCRLGKNYRQPGSFSHLTDIGTKSIVWAACRISPASGLAILFSTIGS
jgi:hypothetical protein